MGNLFEDILNAIGGEGGQKVDVPDIPLPLLKEINPDLYKQVVSMNPELESAVNLGPSAMEGISTDPRLRQAQLNALLKLQDISDNNGKDAQFLADSNRLQNDINSNLRGNTEAIKQNLATRGMSGGMSEMVARNMEAQNSANRQAQMGLDINAQAQQRALQALMNGANLGGQMQSQDFNQQSQIAQAKDAINRFNTQNQQQVQSANVDRMNQAQQLNAQNSQNTANKNVDLSNQAKQYNNNLPQLNFDNQMKKGGMQLSADEAEQQRQEARRSGNLGFAGGLIGAGAAAYGGGK